MAAIYQSAERVLIWLGTYIPYWEQISHVSIASRNAFFEHLRDLSAHPEYIDNSLGLNIVKTSSFHVDEPGFRTCLEQIASNPYFQRVWTVQEYLLAKASDIWWGSDAFPAEGLEAAVNDTNDGSPAVEDCLCFDVSNNDRARSQPLDLWRVQRFTHFKEEFGANRPSLINTINKLQPSGCSDKRDRVYGLLSLASDADGFAVNYKDDLAGLYLRLARYSLTARPVGKYSDDSPLEEWSPRLRAMWTLGDPGVQCEDILTLARTLDLDSEKIQTAFFGNTYPGRFVMNGHKMSDCAKFANDGSKRSKTLTSSPRSYEIWMLHSAYQCRVHNKISEAGATIGGPITAHVENKATLCARCVQSMLDQGNQGRERQLMLRLAASDSQRLYLNLSIATSSRSRFRRSHVGPYTFDALSMSWDNRGQYSEPSPTLRVSFDRRPPHTQNHWLLLGHDGHTLPTNLNSAPNERALATFTILLLPFCTAPNAHFRQVFGRLLDIVVCFMKRMSVWTTCSIELGLWPISL